MGEKSNKVFAGESFSPTNHALYAESPELFASIIKKNFSQEHNYSLVDLGGASGELLANILSKLDGYKFTPTVVDVSQKVLEKNSIAHNKIQSDIINIPVGAKSFDLAIMRYVLAWNSLSDQKKIVQEIARITKGIAIIQHCGADDDKGDEWRQSMEHLLNGSQIEKLRRNFYYFSTADEVERIFIDLKIVYKRVQYRRVENVTNVFIERYELNAEEAKKAREISGKYNYIIQTTWVLDFQSL